MKVTDADHANLVTMREYCTFITCQNAMKGETLRIHERSKRNKSQRSNPRIKNKKSLLQLLLNFVNIYKPEALAGQLWNS